MSGLIFLDLCGFLLIVACDWRWTTCTNNDNFFRFVFNELMIAHAIYLVSIKANDK